MFAVQAAASDLHMYIIVAFVDQMTQNDTRGASHVTSTALRLYYIFVNTV